MSCSGCPCRPCCWPAGCAGCRGCCPTWTAARQPLRESMSLAAAVMAMMMIHRFRQLGMSHESMVLVGATVYLAVRFGVAELLRRFTVHRGMFHSLPAAAISGELAFLAGLGRRRPDPCLHGRRGRARLRFPPAARRDVQHRVAPRPAAAETSFGTAMKVFSHSWWPSTCLSATGRAQLRRHEGARLDAAALQHTTGQRSSQASQTVNQRCGDLPKPPLFTSRGVQRPCRRPAPLADVLGRPLSPGSPPAA